MSARLLPRIHHRLLAVLLCLAAAGCGQSTRAISESAPSDTALGECQRQAYDDPKVKQLLLENLYITANPVHDAALRRARTDAVNACLRAKGVTLPGGVEPVNKSGYLL